MDSTFVKNAGKVCQSNSTVNITPTKMKFHTVMGRSTHINKPLLYRASVMLLSNQTVLKKKNSTKTSDLSYRNKVGAQLEMARIFRRQSHICIHNQFNLEHNVIKQCYLHTSSALCQDREKNEKVTSKVNFWDMGCSHYRVSDIEIPCLGWKRSPHLLFVPHLIVGANDGRPNYQHKL